MRRNSFSSRLVPLVVLAFSARALRFNAFTHNVHLHAMRRLAPERVARAPGAPETRLPTDALTDARGPRAAAPSAAPPQPLKPDAPALAAARARARGHGALHNVVSTLARRLPDDATEKAPLRVVEAPRVPTPYRNNILRVGRAWLRGLRVAPAICVDVDHDAILVIR
mmetsp:Transcript_24632/g.73940  ORF Transcript_24632/g.73940 Transcript_24632/m.73940 type:complete len:168 (-) Transcript_24632:42-545(-)